MPKTHKMYGSGAYLSWHHMKSRCNNPKDVNYKNYGARGIRVCCEWIDCFETFYSDMGDRPEGFQLDRIDNDGDYCKNNCRWVDQKTNIRNSRATKLTAEDVSIIKTLLLHREKTQKEISVLFGVTSAQINNINTGRNWADIPPMPV